MTSEDNYLERSGPRIGIVDVVMLVVLAAAGYLVSGSLGDPADAGSLPTADTAVQQICSDEELRQIKSGPETCFVPIVADRHEFKLAPSSKEKAAGFRNAGPQPSTR